MPSFLSRIKKITSSFLIVAMLQMIFSPVFLNQIYAATNTFTDDVAVGPVQSDTLQIDVTAGTDITSAKWVYDAVCATADYSAGTSLTITGSGNADTNFTVSDETHNGKFVCVEIIDNAVTTTYASANPLNIDTTVPVVSLVGSGTIDIFSGATYTDAGASWTDTTDGTGNTLIGTYGNPGSFQSSGSVNTALTGSYTIEYLKVDVAGNTGSILRTINVQDVVADTVAPVVTLVGSGTVNVLSGATFSDSGATWTDNIDGTGTISAYNSGTLNTSATGTYTISYFYVDVAGNTGSVDRTVNVLDTDTVAPVVTLVGSGTVNVLSGATFSDSGATWTDNIDGTGTISAYNSGTLNTSATGTYTISYFYVDVAGNTGSVDRTVNVLDTDTVAPVVTLVGSGTVNVLSGATFSDSGATWTDNIDGTGTISAYNSGTLNTSATGTYTISYFYVDVAGNTGSVDRTVNVLDTDTVAPTAIITYSPSTTTSGSVVATLTGASENITITNNSGSNTYTFNASGSFTFNFVDDAGNTGSTTATVTWIDTVAPTAIITYSPSTTTSGSVVATLTGASENITITNNSGSNTYTFNASGSFTFNFVDDAGNTGSTTATVTWIDTVAPTAIITYSPSTTTSGSVVATLTGASENITITNNSGSNTYTFNASGSFTFNFVDDAGNTGSTTATVTWIDTVAPTAIITYSPSTTTSGSVVATLTGASENITITNNSGSNTYTFNASGSFTFNFVDDAGNTGSTTATVTWIDTVAPTAIITYSPSTTTSGSVVATLTGASENITITNNSGSNTYTFNASGSFTFNFVDDAGNTGSTTATVTWIDTVAPTAIITYSPSTTTSGSVVATLTGASENITITNNSGSNTYTFNASGSFTFNFVDDAGNTGSTTATVTWIDTVAPTAIITYSPSTTTSGSVVATLTGASENITITNNSGSNTYTFNASGSFTFNFVDDAGNTGSTTATVTWIDTVAPTAIITYSPSTTTSGSVVATLTGASENITITNNSGSNTYTFNASGSFTFNFVDDAGNTGSTTATVTWIDTVAPTAIITYSPSTTTSGSVVATLTGASENITITNNSGSNTYTFNASGSFTFNFVDDAGNTGSTTATVTWIDTVAPTAIITYSPSTTTSGSVVATLTGASENITITNNSGSNTYTFNASGSFTFNFVDDAGNTGSTTATVTWIDTVAPTAIITYSPSTTTSGSVVATLTGASENITITNNSGSNTYTFNASGSFTFNFVDDAGNTGSTTATVTWIDTVAPTAIITYSPSTTTSGSVVATLTGASENITITNNSGSNTYTFNASGSFTFNFVDDAGNTGSTTATVTWIDTVAPTAIITYSPSTTTSGSVVATLTGASENITITNNSGSNTYTFNASGSFTFNFVDDAGNTGSTTATVTWIDTVAPTVTLIGSGIINILSGSTYTDSGASWTDLVDGSGVIATPTTGTVNSSLTGTYILTYSYTDTAGNISNVVNRTVNVLLTPDVTLPVITLIGSGAITIAQNSVYTDLGAIWTDNVDGSGTLVASGSVNTSLTGTYILSYSKTDSSGNVGTGVTRTVIVADLTAPTAIITYSPSTTTSGSVVATLTGASENITITNNSGSNTYTFNASGSFTFNFVDDAGNTGSTTATVTWIDTVAPTAIITYSPSTTTSGSVVATLTGASENITITNNSGSNTYTFNASGSFTFNFVDDAGNTGSTTATVTWIDTVAPTAIITYSPSTTTSGSVVATLTGASENITITNNSGSNTYTFNASGSFTFNFVDDAGNTGSTTATVTWIDTVAPTAIITYSPSTTTSGSVVATLTGASENITITNNSGSNTYTFNASGSFTFNFVDDAGNTGSTTATVTWIDTVAPTAIITYSPSTTTSGSVVATLTGASENITITNNSGSNTYTFNASGSFTFNFVDDAGNTGSTTATVTWIDTVAPTAIITYSPSTTTSGSVVATLTGASENITITNNSGSNTYTFNASGSFTFNFVDDAGNTGSTTATVTWIDTVAPTAIITYSPSTTTSGSVVATLTGASENITITNNSGSNTYTFNASGSFTFNFVDDAGNTGSTTATVTWIDTVAPTAIITYSPSTTTSGSVVATLTGASENITITNNSGSNTYTFNASGSFTFNFVDDAGNTGSTTATVTWIDTVAPTAIITYSPSTTTSGSVVATLTGASENITITNNSGSNTYTFNASGSFTFNFVDDAGNTGSTTATVTWIDTVAPTAIITYSPSTTTSGSVVATLTGASENITITNNSGSNTYTFNASGSFTFNFVDDAGNTGSTTATVTWIDTVAPTVTLIGSGIINILSGSTYTDSGASWTDLVDGSGVILTATSGSVNTNLVGIYILTYQKIDTAGNVSNTVTRTVNVLAIPDTIAPIVTLIGSGSITLIQNAIYGELGASWTDTVDGSGTIIVPTTGTVNTAIPGTYILTYTRTDVAGNVSNTVTRTITVITSFVGGGGAVFTGKEVYLSGATATGITFSAGAGSINLVQSGSTLVIPTNNLTIIASGSSWNGIISGPIFVNAGASILVGGMPVNTSIVYSLGSPGTSLTLSGTVATITLSVPFLSLIGATLPVYRSDDGGVSYNLVSSCVISGTFACSFTTNHFSLFAIGAPIPVSNPVNNKGPGGATVGGGGSSLGGFIFDTTSTGLLLPPNKEIIQKLVRKWTPQKRYPLIRNIEKTPVSSKLIYRVNVYKSLNARSTKSLVAKNIIAYLKKGQIVEVQSIDSNGWATIVLPSGKIAFVRAKYLSQN